MTIDNSSPTAGDLDSNDAASVVLNVPEDLVRRARFGDLAAFESILTAMVGMPWRMAHSIASDLDFAAAATGEGFALVLGPDVPARWSAPDRAGLYVMAATRAAALSSDGAGPLPRISAGTGPRIGAGTGVGSAGTGRAGLMNLPERWRSMLWMVDVEGLAIPQAGIVMGVSTAAAEKLHARAQAGWTRADLRLAGPPAAGATVHLGTKATVAAQGAGPSRGLRAEVPPVPFTMSRIAVDRWRGHQGMAPSEAGAGTVIPLAARSVSEATLVAASGAAIAGTASSRAIAGGSVISQAGDFRSLVRALAEIGQKPLLSAACALVGVGVIGGSLVALLPGPNPSAGNPVAAPVSAAFPNQINSPGTNGAPLPPLPVGFVLATTPTPPAGPAAPGPSSAQPPLTGPPSSRATAPPATAPPTPAGLSVPGINLNPNPTTPVLQTDLGVNLGPVKAGLSVGLGPHSCLGLTVLSITIGCQSPATSSGLLSLDLGSSLLGPIISR